MERIIWIHKSIEDLNNAVASNISNILIQAVNFRGIANFSLSGGTSPTGVYQALAQNEFLNSIPWDSTHFFWGDERCVSPEDQESNYKQAYDHLLKIVPVLPENIHRIKGEYTPEEAVIDYIHVLANFAQGKNSWPIFDIALMGIGEDGHTASLFPGVVNRKEIEKPVIQVNASYQDRPSTRITLTPMVFNSSRNVIFLAVGNAKAKILHTALSGPIDPLNVPVQRIQPAQGNIIWHIDSEAAKYLDKLIDQ